MPLWVLVLGEIIWTYGIFTAPKISREGKENIKKDKYAWLWTKAAPPFSIKTIRIIFILVGIAYLAIYFLAK